MKGYTMNKISEMLRKQAETPLFKHTRPISRTERRRIIKAIIECLETAETIKTHVMNAVFPEAKSIAISLLGRDAPQHDDDRDYYELLDAIIDQGFRSIVSAADGLER